MKQISRTELYSALQQNHNWKSALMWLEDGLVFDATRQGVSLCMEVLSWCDFSEFPKRYPHENRVFQWVIFNRLGYRAPRLVLIIACQQLGIQIQKTGVEFIFQLPEPQNPEALKAIKFYYDNERRVNN